LKGDIRRKKNRFNKKKPKKDWGSVLIFETMTLVISSRLILLQVNPKK
jgi:hypothetical protein